MKYLIIGAGGVGATLAVYMYRAGLDISLALTKRHKELVDQEGLKYSFWDGTTDTYKIEATETGQLNWDIYDVIFVCVKSGQLPEVLTRLKDLAYKAVIIPMMNGIGNADIIREELPEAEVGDACVYLGAYKKEYNWIQQDNNGVKIILDKKTSNADKICEDLRAAGMIVKLSDKIEHDKFLKFFFVSPLAAAQAVYGCSSGEIFASPEKKEYFRRLSEELYSCAAVAGLNLPEDAVEKNIIRLGKMPPDSFASMARDYLDGKAYERNVMVDEALMLGRRHAVEMKFYKEVSALSMKGRGE